MTEIHARHMQRALELAERGWGRVHPNPLVGAVVVLDGAVVGEGLHREFGGAHAEIEALAAAGERARGATLYVTLEPCCHHGKTPPCTDAIVRAGIATVVFGATDPHAEAGGGAEVLRQAGINVEGGVEADAARAQNAIFYHYLTHDTPFVALKLAMSLDARITAGHGERTRITGDVAAREVHRLRSGFDGILVGSNTVRIDDPLLTVRGVPAPIRPPIRIVLDSAAALSLNSALLGSLDAAPVWVVCGPNAPAARVRELAGAGVHIVLIAHEGDRIPMRPMLERLRAEGITSVLCEGGSAVAGSLLGSDAVERLYVFLAPMLLGERGLPAFSVSEPLESALWRTVRIAQLGNDALLMLQRVRESQA